MGRRYNVIDNILKQLKNELDKIDNFDKKIDVINKINKFIAEINPLQEPVKCVQWIKGERVKANSWNPNKVAPPEMKLLYDSIKCDGYTQPVVANKMGDGTFQVVDGYHRNRIGKEHKDIKERLHGYLPIVELDKDISDSMASTIRHNRARGSHDVELMGNVVKELHELGRTDHWISKHLGMELDEIIRLKQETGLAELFKDNDFSQAWTINKGDV